MGSAVEGDLKTIVLGILIYGSFTRLSFLSSNQEMMKPANWAESYIEREQGLSTWTEHGEESKAGDVTWSWEGYMLFQRLLCGREDNLKAMNLLPCRTITDFLNPI